MSVHTRINGCDVLALAKQPFIKCAIFCWFDSKSLDSSSIDTVSRTTVSKRLEHELDFLNVHRFPSIFKMGMMALNWFLFRTQARTSS